MEEDVKKYAGERMLAIRKERKLRQEDVANAVGITRASLSYYENGERTIGADVLFRICRFYNVSADYILGLKEEEPEIDLIKIMRKTGLSEKSLTNLLNLENSMDTVNSILENLKVSKI